MLATAALPSLGGCRPAPPGARALSPEERSRAREILAEPSDERPLKPPPTAEEAAREEVEASRAPFYRRVRAEYGEAVRRCAADRADTLSLTLAPATPETITSICQNVLAVDGARFGFRRAEFWAPNPPGESRPARLVAECLQGESGLWTIIWK
ncbi:MAG: hypothetical protein IT208_02395 [Chthonomonadales bacterium]|nr:hypothetical protein [Chthonomonadales bacterium]